MMMTSGRCPALPPPRAAGDDMAFALVFDFDQLVLVGQLQLLVGRQLGQQLFQSGVAEAGDELEAALFEGFQINLAAHAAIESKNRFGDRKAAAQARRMNAPIQAPFDIGGVLNKALKAAGLVK